MRREILATFQFPGFWVVNFHSIRVLSFYFMFLWAFLIGLTSANPTCSVQPTWTWNVHFECQGSNSKVRDDSKISFPQTHFIHFRVSRWLVKIKNHRCGWKIFKRYILDYENEFLKITVRFFVKYRFFRHMNFYLSVARNIIIDI